uniref:CMP/dCMP-type deaminase domain-containing protein n=1 Tax=Varanus komodoensis TaxID=61221 RepID=A0A8D2Q8N2_VARKO
MPCRVTQDGQVIAEKNFNNTTPLKKTFVLFSLKKESNSLWKVWGYGYNNPGKEHAEVLVLDAIKEYIAENQNCRKYKVTLFLSHSPCHECSARILSFLTSRNGIQMEIKASRPYFLNNEEERKGLWYLKKASIPVKMMDRFDYQKSFNLFVHPTKKFTPWLAQENKMSLPPFLPHLFARNMTNCRQIEAVGFVLCAFES